MINFDSTLLEKLVKNEISAYDFEIGNIKLGNSYKTISIIEINEAYIENSDINMPELYVNETITEKFEALQSNNGYVHLAGGLTCKIKNSIIVDFTLSKKYLAAINDFTRDTIIKHFGIPDYELIDENSYGGYSYEIENYILVYKSKNLNFSTHPKTEKIIEISTAQIDITNLKKR